MNINAKIFSERLKIPEQTGQWVGYCIFHPDSGTRSLSVDLDKAVFYCHGGCDEPKGGGPVEFLVKWAKIVEKKTLTRAEARLMLRRTFTVPNAKTLLREAVEDRLLYFAKQMFHGYADALRLIEHEIDRVAASLSPKSTHWTWDGLAALYRERTRFENAYAIASCAVVTQTISEPLIELHRTLTRDGLWNDVEATIFRAQSRKFAIRSRVDARRPVHAPRTPIAQESESSCLVRPSPTTSPKTLNQSPKILTQPVSSKRQPIP